MEAKEMVQKVPVMQRGVFELGPVDIRRTGWGNLVVFVRWMDT